MAKTGLSLSRRSLLAGSLALSLDFAPTAAKAAKLPNRKVAAFARQLDNLAQDEDFSGTVLLADASGPMLFKAYGLAERNFSVRAQRDTRFAIASMGKLFTSLAILQLAASGRIDIDRPLAAYWPDYSNREFAAQATIADLLGHRSGLGNYAEQLAGYAGPPLLSHDDYLRLFAAAPAPGKRGEFLYSNNGYIVLGCLVERLTGVGFFDHVARTIWQPLAMTATGPLRQDQANGGAAIGYFRSPENPGQWQMAVDPRIPVGTAAGGIYASAADIDRFGAAMAKGALLPAALHDRWTRGVSPYHLGSYGLGVSESRIGEHRIIGHSGGHPGSAVELMLFEPLGLRLTILSNGDFDGFFAAIAAAKTLFAGQDAWTASHEHSRELAAAFIDGGADSARVLLAARGNDVKARFGVLELQAQKLWHRGDSATAIALLAFAGEMFPENAWAKWSLAEMLRHSRQWSGARAAYAAYLERVPEDRDAQMWLERMPR